MRSAWRRMRIFFFSAASSFAVNAFVGDVVAQPPSLAFITPDRSKRLAEEEEGVAFVDLFSSKISFS